MIYLNANAKDPSAFTISKSNSSTHEIEIKKHDAYQHT